MIGQTYQCPSWFQDSRVSLACKTQQESNSRHMPDYSEPLANMPATLARLTAQLGERDYTAALATADDVLRRMQVARDWLLVRVERQNAADNAFLAAIGALGAIQPKGVRPTYLDELRKAQRTSCEAAK